MNHGAMPSSIPPRFTGRMGYRKEIHFHMLTEVGFHSFLNAQYKPIRPFDNTSRGAGKKFAAYYYETTCLRLPMQRLRDAVRLSDSLHFPINSRAM